MSIASLVPPFPMLHAPDGFFSFPVAVVMWALTLIALGVSIQRTNRHLDERSIPLMGTTAAFIFAAQMFNFQVIGGTSGHLLGGVFAAVLLGPWVGTLVMTCVIAVQALIFQDGGLVVLGANIFNMGVVGTLGGYYLYRGLARLMGGEGKARIPAAGIAAWASVVTASVLTAVELALSGTSPLAIALPAMLGIHLFIGVGEALITMGALAFIQATRSDLFTLRDASLDASPSAA